MITKIQKYILVWFAISATIFITGCAMPEEPESHSEQGQTMNEAPVEASSKKPKADPISQWVGHMDEVHVGMSQSQVKDILGKPDDTNSTEMSLPDFSSDGSTSEKTTVMDSWTYGDMFDDADGDDIWMLSFTDGELDSKTRM